MRRKILLLIGFFAVFALLASACGDDDDATAGDDGSTSDDGGTEEPTEAPTEEPTQEPTEGPTEAPTEEPTEAPTEEPMEPIDVGIVQAVSLNGLQIHIGDVKGFYEANGLDIDLVSVSTGPEVAAAILSGEADFAHNTPNNILALVNEGAGVVGFHTANAASNFDILVSNEVALPDDPTDWEATMAALDGTTVGVVARGAAAEDLARTLYTLAGLDPDDATYVATGGPATTLAALSSGEIQWTLTFEPGLTQAAGEAFAIAPFSLREGGGPLEAQWPGTLVMTRTDLAEENPEALARYRRAMDDTVAWMNDPANRDELIDITAEFLGLEPELTADLLEQNVPYLSPDGVLDLDRNQAVADIGFELGKYSEAYPVDEWLIDIPK